MTALLLGCGLRRAELAGLTVEALHQREEHWVSADLVGKGGHVRTVTVPPCECYCRADFSGGKTRRPELH